jgi:hypothetical protein
VIFASAHDLAALGRELAARGIMRVIGAATGRIIGADGFEAADYCAGQGLHVARETLEPGGVAQSLGAGGAALTSTKICRISGESSKAANR